MTSQIFLLLLLFLLVLLCLIFFFVEVTQERENLMSYEYFVLKVAQERI